jgi:hypothetical protein
MRALRTVDEHRLCVVNRDIERHDRTRTRSHRNKAAVNASRAGIRSLNRLAWLRERGLRDSVVDLRELELHDVARVGLDIGGCEDERFVDGGRADDDGYYF